VQEQIGLNNRIFLTGAVRGDDNSAFGANFNFVTYPKVSLSWIINEEPFWHVPLVSALQLRAAFGVAGQQPNVYAAAKTYQASSGQAGTTVTPQNIGNPDLKPSAARNWRLVSTRGFSADRVAVSLRITSSAIATRS
jgi:outer membrane receptor for ferrienterochelin and colicin